MILLRERFQEVPEGSRKSLNCILLDPVWNVPKVPRLMRRDHACQALNWEDSTSGFRMRLFRRELRQFIDTQLFFQLRDLIHDLEEAFIAKQFVFLLFEVV